MTKGGTGRKTNNSDFFKTLSQTLRGFRVISGTRDYGETKIEWITIDINSIRGSEKVHVTLVSPEIKLSQTGGHFGIIIRKVEGSIRNEFNFYFRNLSRFSGRQVHCLQHTNLKL